MGCLSLIWICDISATEAVSTHQLWNNYKAYGFSSSGFKMGLDKNWETEEASMEFPLKKLRNGILMVLSKLYIINALLCYIYYVECDSMLYKYANDKNTPKNYD